MYLLGWVYHAAVRLHSPEEGRDTGFGRSSQTENPPNEKTGWKNLEKSECGELTLMEKCPQLLFIKHIWRSQKFDKPTNYHFNYGIRGERYLMSENLRPYF
jgi:hypothetical protein